MEGRWSAVPIRRTRYDLNPLSRCTLIGRPAERRAVGCASPAARGASGGELDTRLPPLK